MGTLKERVTRCAARHPEISQAEIARAAGVRPPSVADWFNGKTKSLKLRPAWKAAQVWGCDPLWLGEGVGSPGWIVDQHHGKAAPDLIESIPVVLDAMARAPQRDKLRTALLAVLDDDAPAYRQRLAELLTEAQSPGQPGANQPPAKQTAKRFAA